MRRMNMNMCEIGLRQKQPKIIYITLYTLDSYCTRASMNFPHILSDLLWLQKKSKNRLDFGQVKMFRKFEKRMLQYLQ